ncbi:MAG: hypothetical protein AAF703_08645 [Cyanobacteria bacterium P01_D01_bin.105]
MLDTRYVKSHIVFICTFNPYSYRIFQRAGESIALWNVSWETIHPKYRNNFLMNQIALN